MHRIAFRVAGGSENIRGPDFDEVLVDGTAIATLENANGPFSLDEHSLRSEALRRFRDVNVRLVVPLVTQGTLIGMLNLGPRMSETDYSSDDHKLLDGLSGNAAAAVRVALLVREHETDMREKERIENEMRVAQLIQRQLVPKDLPVLTGWKVYAYYHPAREVGGDFYDFIHLPDGRLAVVVGDVTGKGVPAALVMASTRSILRGEAPRLLSPARVLERTNDQLVNDIPPEMFVTCFCGVVDPDTGQMVYANAGHSLPFLRDEGGVTEVRATGMPLGLLPGVVYEELEMTLAPATSLVLHSDGLAEALSNTREMFGLPRMMDLIERCFEPELIISHLLDGVRSFTGENWEQDDDITLAVIHRKPAVTGASETEEDERAASRRPRLAPVADGWTAGSRR
jgi:serine phosphatase RsbU (regulator of sigma subunit)